MNQRTARFFLVSWGAALAAALALLGCAAPAGAPHREPLADRVRASAKDASMNLRAFPEPAGGVSRFLVAGHVYGTIQGDDRLPAKTLLDQMPALGQLNLRMLVSLGDMVKHSETEDFDLLDELLLQPAAYPVFNTVGNHDVENRALYEERYGPTYFSFRDMSSWFIFLDTEREVCSIDAPQQEMLAQALEAALAEDEVRQIFIFMHKTLFFKNERLFGLKKEIAGPNVWDCYNTGNFAQILARLIEPAAQQKPVYLFAGDVGAYGNLSPYYERRSDLPLTMVMTGIGEFPTDSAILVTVDDGDVRMEVYPLAGQAPEPLENYSPEYWIRRAGPN